MRVITRLFQIPIVLYRFAVSPLLGPRCRFLPTCSAYALEALEVHGPWSGTLLALRRLARCHPISWLGAGQGYDPVPARTSPLAPDDGVRHIHAGRSCCGPAASASRPAP